MPECKQRYPEAARLSQAQEVSCLLYQPPLS